MSRTPSSSARPESRMSSPRGRRVCIAVATTTTPHLAAPLSVATMTTTTTPRVLVSSSSSFASLLSPQNLSRSPLFPLPDNARTPLVFPLLPLPSPLCLSSLSVARSRRLPTVLFTHHHATPFYAGTFTELLRRTRCSANQPLPTSTSNPPNNSNNRTTGTSNLALDL